MSQHPPLSEPIEQDALLARFVAGDAQAARDLTAQLVPRVYGQAFRMLNRASDAEDVSQEAMMRLWKIAPEWRAGEAKVTTWLYRIVHNLAIDLLRKRGRGVDLDSAPELASGAASALTQIQSKSRAEALQEALMTLPERQRQAVILRHIEGLSNPEIAQIMEIGVEAVESLTSRGKRALSGLLLPQKEALGYEGYDDEQ